jgi:phenylalanyl-tRNA synthetase beta chain
MLFEIDLNALTARDLPQLQPLPRQQAVQRDLALVVSDAVSHDALIAAALDDVSGLVRHAKLFDIFKPKPGTAGMAAHERSMALRLTLLDDEHTLDDARIDAAVASTLQRLQTRVGARLRG